MDKQQQKAAKYERMYPDTGCSEGQKAERYEREEHKRRRREGEQTVSSKYFTVNGLKK